MAVATGSSEFTAYKSGVISSTSCGTTPDTFMLAVGYGTEADGTEYFLVQNSLGTGWGDQGFVKIAASD